MSQPLSASGSGSRLPRLTPQQLIARPSTSVGVTCPTADKKPSDSRQPKNPSISAITLAIKKRYSSGRKGLVRNTPPATKPGAIKRPLMPNVALGKRASENVGVGPSKRPRVLTDRNNPADSGGRPAATNPSSGVKASTVTKTGAKKVVNSTKNQENGSQASEASSSQAKPKRKIQPWDFKGKLELAEEKIRTLKDQVAEKEARITQLEETCGSGQSVLDDLNAQLTAEKATSASYLQEMHEKDLLMQRLESERDMLEQRLESEKRALASENFRLSTIMAGFEKTVADLRADKQHLETEREELCAEVNQLHDTRKHLHNLVQDLKGNIRVFCRVRPPTPIEISSSVCHVEYEDLTSLELYKKKEDVTNRQKKITGSFSFDRVFPAASTQEDVYTELEQLVQSALDGYNVCVFAYGQTGSGKTYTMDGVLDDEKAKGMISRSVETIFHEIERLKKLGWEYSVEVSFVEIYNELIRDLLNYNSGLNHEIRMVPNKKCEVFISNLRVEPVKSQSELNAFMEVARNNRFTASTVCNTHSSRSHFVMKIAVNGSHAIRQLDVAGSISLVDLAGSERYVDNNSEDRLKETMNINKSLSSLSNVVLALKQKKDHIPYRNSKLTHLLMPSLGGSSKILMIVNISPLEDCFNESVNSLRFASSVKECRVVAKRNQKSTASL